jgi:hypothetical protein
MALKLYNPRTKAFVTFTPPDNGDIPLSDLLALNILIELKVLSHYMSQQNVGSAYEDTSNVLADVVSVT